MEHLLHGMARAPGEHIIAPSHVQTSVCAIGASSVSEHHWPVLLEPFCAHLQLATHSTQVAVAQVQVYHPLAVSCRSSTMTGMVCMRPLLAMASAAPPLPSSDVWVAASTPRLLTWVLTWWARWRRTFLRMTPATLPPLQVGIMSGLWALWTRPDCSKAPPRQIPGPACWPPCGLDASGHHNCIKAASIARPYKLGILCIWTPQWRVGCSKDAAAVVCM